MPTRKEIQECLCSDFASVADGKSIDQAVAFLETLKANTSFLRFQLVVEDAGEYDYHQTFLRIYGIRLETQEEYDKRLLKDKAKKDKALAKVLAKRDKLRQQLSVTEAELIRFAIAREEDLLADFEFEKGN